LVINVTSASFSGDARAFELAFVFGAYMAYDFVMPTISSFFGIVIQMFWREHAPPHFHHCMPNSKSRSIFGLSKSSKEICRAVL